jgi:hypothetical protein
MCESLIHHGIGSPSHQLGILPPQEDGTYMASLWMDQT